ncbi:hypothetical protein ES703_12384 [subsurface metagenome]
MSVDRLVTVLMLRCEDVRSGHKKTVFNDPSIDKRFSSALDFAALRTAGGLLGLLSRSILTVRCFLFFCGPPCPVLVLHSSSRSEALQLPDGYYGYPFSEFGPLRASARNPHTGRYKTGGYSQLTEQSLQNPIFGPESRTLGETVAFNV